MEIARFSVRVVVALIVTVATYGLCCAAVLGPHTSYYYSRFTSAKQGSLVVGTSRAAQGIRPDTVMAALGDVAPTMPLYNFAFTMVNSPFGRTYLDAMRRKLREPDGSAVSIVEVSPLAISENRPTEGPDVAAADGRSFLATMRIVDMNPNLEFPLRHQRIGFQVASCLQGWLMKRYRTYLHPDGWLEVLTPKLSKKAFAAKFAAKIAGYRKKTARVRRSETRVSALRETLGALRQRGPVFLVRLPTSRAMLEVEAAYMPDFSMRMETIAVEMGARYVDMTPNASDYETTDGNHLERSSAERASRRLGEIMRAALRAAKE